MGSVGGVLMSSGRSWGGHGVGFGATGEPSGTSGRHLQLPDRAWEDCCGRFGCPWQEAESIEKTMYFVVFLSFVAHQGSLCHSRGGFGEARTGYCRHFGGRATHGRLQGRSERILQVPRFAGQALEVPGWASDTLLDEPWAM